MFILAILAKLLDQTAASQSAVPLTTQAAVASIVGLFSLW